MIAKHSDLHMKGAFYSICYFVMLVFSLGWAFERWADDFWDPAVINPNVDYHFWCDGFGVWLWFGSAIVVPALILFALDFALKRLGWH
jgi:hypothetical protein